MPASLHTLDKQGFDVLVVGGGINGAAAAQHLAAAGYGVLLVEKGDFGSGTTSRSSRMQGCGLNYFFAFAPGGALWRYATHPGRALNALGMARDAMRMRAQMLRTTPQRLRTFDWSYPIYRRGKYSGPQLRAGLRLLDAMAPADGKLGLRSLSAEQARRAPLLRYQHHPEDLLGAATVTYVQYDWPERITVDTILDAERMGAVVRNHTTVTALRRVTDGWECEVQDSLAPGARATVTAKVLVNTAGIWIDGMNALAEPSVRRRVAGNKGVHIAFQLPPDCAGQAVVNFSSGAEPFFCAPFGRLHYIGPTEEAHSAEPGDLAVTEDDIEHLRHEADQALPGIGLRRKDILFAWAGVRPLTRASAEFPGGRRGQVLHDLAADGMPDALALTGGAIMTHRIAARDVAAAVATKLAPSRPRQELSYAPASFPDDSSSPALMPDDPSVRLSDLRHAVRQEHARTLTDLLFRRVPVGWSETMGHECCQRAAEAVADLLGWDRARLGQEVTAYRAYVEAMFRFRAAQAETSIAPAASQAA